MKVSNYRIRVRSLKTKSYGDPIFETDDLLEVAKKWDSMKDMNISAVLENYSGRAIETIINQDYDGKRYK